MVSVLYCVDFEHGIAVLGASHPPPLPMSPSTNNQQSDGIYLLLQRSHITEWGIAETQGKGPFAEVLEYDIFVNCILLTEVLVI